MPSATSCTINQDRIRELFEYNPSTGLFYRKEDQTRFVLGPLKVDGQTHEVARYIWLWVFGFIPKNMLVEHKDRDRTNNKLNNLRLASYSENGYNLLYHNQHGYKGVTYDPLRKKCWRAQIRINGIKTNLGRFLTKEEAATAYAEAAKKYHGEFLCLK